MQTGGRQLICAVKCIGLAKHLDSSDYESGDISAVIYTHCDTSSTKENTLSNSLLGGSFALF